MAFSSAGRSVKLYFEGDATNLDRTLARTETKLKRFERVAGKQSSTFNSGLLGGFSKGGAITAGAGLAVLGIKNVTDAAKNAQVILGQTSVAVTDAGLSWTKYSDTVQKASMRISKSSAFDDEQVLQSFSVFVRGQKDVGKALQLSQLAADVARGRYTDLATATQLVNKAAMGQIGALRRAGIQIDKNATSTQALAALQAAYGGAAVKYANSAAGSQDRLRVSVENLRESLGKGLLPVLSSITKELSDGADQATRFVDSLSKVKIPSLPGLPGGTVGNAAKKGAKLAFDLSPGYGQGLFVQKQLMKLFGGGKGKKPTAEQLGAASSILNLSGLAGLKAAGLSGRKGFKVSAPNGPTTDLPTGLKNKEIDARIGGNRNVLKGVLAKEAAFLQKEILNSVPEDQTVLKQALLGITDEIKSIDDQIIQDANDKQQAAKDAAAQAKAAAAARKAKIRDALKAQVQAFKDQADAIKNAVLDSLDKKQTRVQNARALEDAKANLKKVQQLGGAGAIKMAKRDVADAQFAVQRQQIQDTKFGVTAGPRGPVNSLTVGNMVFNVNTNDPEKVVKAVVEHMRKANRRATSQSRGTIAGRNFGVGIN